MQYLIYFKVKPTAKPWHLSQQAAKRLWWQNHLQNPNPGPPRTEEWGQGEICPSDAETGVSVLQSPGQGTEKDCKQDPGGAGCPAQPSGREPALRRDLAGRPLVVWVAGSSTWALPQQAWNQSEVNLGGSSATAQDWRLVGSKRPCLPRPGKVLPRLVPGQGLGDLSRLTPLSTCCFRPT